MRMKELKQQFREAIFLRFYVFFYATNQKRFLPSFRERFKTRKNKKLTFIQIKKSYICALFTEQCFPKFHLTRQPSSLTIFGNVWYQFHSLLPQKWLHIQYCTRQMNKFFDNYRLHLKNTRSWTHGEQNNAIFVVARTSRELLYIRV